MFQIVPKEMVFQAWPVVKEYIEDALDFSNGELEISDVGRDLLEGKKQLWAGFDDEMKLTYAVVTSILVFPQYRACEISYFGGEESQDWEMIVSTISEWGLTQECEMVYIVGRPAWKKLLKSQGFEPTYTVLTKVIGDQDGKA